MQNQTREVRKLSLSFNTYPKGIARVMHFLAMHTHFQKSYKSVWLHTGWFPLNKQIIITAIPEHILGNCHLAFWHYPFCAMTSLICMLINVKARLML